MLMLSVFSWGYVCDGNENAEYSVNNAKFLLARVFFLSIQFLADSHCMPFLVCLMYSISFISVSI